MGHSHLGPFPKSKKWQQVVRLVDGEAAAALVAAAVLAADEAAFAAAPDDPGVVDAARGRTDLGETARGHLSGCNRTWGGTRAAGTTPGPDKN